MRFEGSFRGIGGGLDPKTRLECKVCWHVYDPAEGCETWQIPAGTAFVDLPDHWRCPVCDGDREQFMVLDQGEGIAAAPAPAIDPRLDEIVRTVPPRLEAAFREIHAGQMRGVPIVNETLSVKAVGFRAYEGRVFGMLITPWFMNLVLLPGPDQDWTRLATGTKELIAFPSGWYEFLSANRPETGPYKACSLFSPMFDFTSMLQATETATAALLALLDPAHREEGAPTAEIRRRRTEELAAHEAGEAAASRDEGVSLDVAEQRPVLPPQPTRRELIFGAAAGARAASEPA
ncbi:[NiFe]-hydrogenase assembly chaperone HybE [Xanthobacter sp. VNH20]|uniref:[NiFe]-hydrogenase assembly chaperone HybE n=1 Tax=Xanthobacter sp. VNH20 TaxID=3156616 RepID=UPI0032B5C963